VYPPPFQHGASGIKGAGPSLLGVGALAADFYVRTGYMPLGDPSHQPETNRRLWSARERHALVAYVASLSKGPPVPHPDPAAGRMSEGLQLFTEHCAGCHQVSDTGGWGIGHIGPIPEGMVTWFIAVVVLIAVCVILGTRFKAE
jgi:mono/diheme cytochrome c family protein